MKKTLIALALTAGATFGAMAQDIVDRGLLVFSAISDGTQS